MPLRPARIRNRSVYLALLIFLFVFFLLFYAVMNDFYYVDFSSLYAAMNAVWQDENPYRVLSTDYLPSVKLLPANLNPPFTLLFFSPLHFLNYHSALMLYFFLSILLGMIGAGLCGFYFLERNFWNRYSWQLIVFYLSLFSTLAGVSIAQLGTLLFFLLMAGYHFYRNNKNLSASLVFALAIAIKLFPGVILFFLLQQKRYRMLLFTGGWLLIFLLLPLIFFRTDLYSLYCSMMHRVMWYGDNWNGSFFGILMRIFVDTNHTNIDLWPYQAIWLAFVFPVLFAYTRSYRFAAHPRRSFAMALLLMIFLSPLGWLYYFSLLLPALAVAFRDAERRGAGAMLLWFVTLVFINFPIDYVTDALMGSRWIKLTFYSLHAYGVLFLVFLMLRSPGRPIQSLYTRQILYWPVYWNQIFGLLVFTVIVFSRL